MWGFGDAWNDAGTFELSFDRAWDYYAVARSHHPCVSFGAFSNDISTKRRGRPRVIASQDGQKIIKVSKEKRKSGKSNSSDEMGKKQWVVLDEITNTRVCLAKSWERLRQAPWVSLFGIYRVWGQQYMLWSLATYLNIWPNFGVLNGDQTSK